MQVARQKLGIPIYLASNRNVANHMLNFNTLENYFEVLLYHYISSNGISLLDLCCLYGCSPHPCYRYLCWLVLSWFHFDDYSSALRFFESWTLQTILNYCISPYSHIYTFCSEFQRVYRYLEAPRLIPRQASFGNFIPTSLFINILVITARLLYN